jgi:phosphoribosyl 1,2-cyclic phosphodiesterase
VPHDAREPVQYVFTDGAARLGVVTDLGTVTQHVVGETLGVRGAGDRVQPRPRHADGRPYPVSLKHRVSGRFGHLSNTDAGRLVAAVERSRLRHLIAAHLSQQNNKPELAVKALSEAAGCEPEWVGRRHPGRRIWVARRMK